MKSPLFIAFLLAGVKLVLFLIAGNRYGYFRDELYFLASTDHLALGYPDHAPLSIWIGKFSKTLFGDSLYAIRLLPALAGAAKILITGILVREFGGKHLATFLACLCVLVAPVYLGIDNLMGMNAYEPLFWMGCVLTYVWAVKRNNPSYWLMFGALAGLGLMNKHSMLFFGIALAVGFVLTKDRALYGKRDIWLAALLAVLIFLPNIVWQYQNDWATFELLKNVAETGKNVENPPHVFVLQQVLIHGPLSIIVWLAGVLYLLFGEKVREFRSLGIAYLLTLGLMIFLGAKHYYLSPAYPMLFAAGAVFWEGMVSGKTARKILMYVYCALLAIGGAMVAPLTLPLIPIENVADYRKAIGMPSTKTEVGHRDDVPQIFGDQFGWEEMTRTVADVYRALPEDEQKKAAIFGENYGQAGAIDQFGPKYGLPKAISAHQSYYLWGHRDYDGSVLILLGVGLEDAKRSCREVEEGPQVGNRYAMASESFRILICRDLKEPLSELWPKIKKWR